VPHTDNMEAKGYSRWVHHLQQPKKKAAQVGTSKTIDFDKNMPLFMGVQQVRWAAYPIEDDGEPNYEESLPLKTGVKYQFVPPPPMGQKPFNGKLLAIDERRGKLTIEVLKVVG